MYLSRLRLRLRDRGVVRAMSDCQLLHRLVMEGFPVGDRENRSGFGVLFRRERDFSGMPRLLVQSAVEPDWEPLESHLLGEPEVRELNGVYDGLRAGMTLRFRLRANPTKRTGKKDKQKAGLRVDLRKEKEQLDWLKRKAEAGGFSLAPLLGAGDFVEVNINPEPQVVGWKSKRRLTFGSVLIEGLLRVEDAETFRRTLSDGVGTAKAYGFGLLSVAPPS